MSLAITETAGILCLLVGLLSIIIPQEITFTYALSRLGLLGSLAIPGFITGINAAFPARQALLAVARQPFSQAIIMNVLLIGQSMIQTPVIFGFIMSLLIYAITPVTDAHAVQIIAAGFALGIGCIGPSIGLSTFAQTACSTIARNPAIYNQFFSFMFMSQALIEAPLLFSFIVGIMILYFKLSVITYMGGIFTLAAALAMGLSTLGAGISSGRISANASRAIATYPQELTAITSISFLAQTFVDTAPLYGLIVSLLILFLTK